MTTRPPLSRSIPFWVLLVGSVATAAVGAWLVSDRLGIMTATLNDGTATGVEVYVGQSVAVLGAILVGAGVVGLLLTLAVATAASLRPRTAVASPPAYTAPTAATSAVPAAEDLDAPATTDAEPNDAPRDLEDAPRDADAQTAPAEDTDLTKAPATR